MLGTNKDTPGSKHLWSLKKKVAVVITLWHRLQAPEFLIGGHSCENLFFSKILAFQKAFTT